VLAYDVDAERLSAAAAGGATAATSLSDMSDKADIFVACLRTDDQMEAVAEDLVAHGKPGQLLVVAGTHSLDFMQRLAGILKPKDMRLIDAPVVFGALGATKATCCHCVVATRPMWSVRPVLDELAAAESSTSAPGAGQIARTCNNLLH
jgi:3-hydroxyisobutyrate dehydrogenase-like beta-hydroxyacid dehydrogenase